MLRVRLTRRGNMRPNPLRRPRKPQRASSSSRRANQWQRKAQVSSRGPPIKVASDAPPPVDAATVHFPAIKFSPETDEFCRAVSRQKAHASRGKQALSGFNDLTVSKHIMFLLLVNDAISRHPGKCMLVFARENNVDAWHFPLYCMRLSLA